MAEFCISCFNELNGTHYTEQEVWTEEDFCEGCGEWKQCVFELRPKPFVLRVIDRVKSVLQKK